MRRIYFKNDILFECQETETNITVIARAYNGPAGCEHTAQYTADNTNVPEGTLEALEYECMRCIFQKVRLAEAQAIVKSNKNDGIFEVVLKPNNGVLKITKRTDVKTFSFEGYNQCLHDCNIYHNFCCNGVYAFFLQSEADNSCQLYFTTEIHIFEVNNLVYSVLKAKERLLSEEADWKEQSVYLESVYLANRNDFDNYQEWEDEF